MLAIVATLSLLAPVAQPAVEIPDWHVSVQVSSEEPQGFLFEPAAPLPYVNSSTLTSTASVFIPTATIDVDYDFRANDDGARFDISMVGTAGPSPDSDNDGPQTQLVFLLRVNETVTYDFSAESTIDTVVPGNLPLVAALVHDRFCFMPGYRPATPDENIGCTFVEAVIDVPRLTTTGTVINFDMPCDPPAFCRPDKGAASGTLEPGEYTVIAFAGAFLNAGGDATAEVSFVVGTPPPDCGVADLNFDSNLNATDINQFVQAFLASDPAADINGDLNFNATDINQFVQAFLAGCS